MNKSDDELSRALADTLNQSLDHLNAEEVDNLQQLRQQVLGKSSRTAVFSARKKMIASFAIAASVTVMVIFIPRETEKIGDYNAIAALDDSVSYLQEDPEMLDNMDMLMALEDIENDS